MRRLVLFLALAAVAVAATPDQAVREAVGQGRSTYRELSRAFYGEQTDAIFAAKVAYQQQHPEMFWLADYAVDADRAVKLAVYPAKSYAFKDGADGCYDSKGDSIMLKDRGGEYSVSDVIHELGHAAQRTRVLSKEANSTLALDLIRTKAGWSAYNRIRYPAVIALWLGKKPGRLSSHGFVEYLCNNVEFEIRVQAMNRYYFAKTGRAISTEAEGRECLSLAATEANPEFLRLYREVFELVKVRALIVKEDGEEQADLFWRALAQLAPGHA